MLCLVYNRYQVYIPKSVLLMVPSEGSVKRRKRGMLYLIVRLMTSRSIPFPRTVTLSRIETARMLTFVSSLKTKSWEKKDFSFRFCYSRGKKDEDKTLKIRLTKMLKRRDSSSFFSKQKRTRSSSLFPFSLPSSGDIHKSTWRRIKNKKTELNKRERRELLLV